MSGRPAKVVAGKVEAGRPLVPVMLLGNVGRLRSPRPGKVEASVLVGSLAWPSPAAAVLLRLGRFSGGRLPRLRLEMFGSPAGMARGWQEIDSLDHK